MDAKAIRTALSWAAVLTALIGPFLPWVSGTSAAAEVYDFFTSSVSRPNLEWLIWFFAPLGAGLAGGAGLLRRLGVGRSALVPCAIFLLAWAALLLTGYRAYTGFSAAGFAVTWAGVVGLTVLSATNKPIV